MALVLNLGSFFLQKCFQIWVNIVRKGSASQCGSVCWGCHSRSTHDDTSRVSQSKCMCFMHSFCIWTHLLVFMFVLIYLFGNMVELLHHPLILECAILLCFPLPWNMELQKLDLKQSSFTYLCQAVRLENLQSSVGNHIMWSHLY